MARLLAVSATIAMVVLIGYQTYDIARADYGMDRPTAAVMLGLLGLAQFVPLFLLTPVAGAAADRFDRRRVVLFANLIDCVIAGLLAILTLAETLTLPILFALAAAHGAARAFNGPALSAIAPNVVPNRLLPKAIALSSIAWQIGTVVGPAAGGLMFGASPPLPYFCSAGLLLVSGLLISSIRPIRPVQEGPPARPMKQIIQGFSFVWTRRFLLGCISLDLFAVLLGGATAMLPVFARDVLHAGPEGLGHLRAAPAVGATLTAAYFSMRPLRHNVGAKMLAAVGVFGGATILFGVSRWMPLSLACLALLGAADMFSVYVPQSLIQLYTPDEMRGRVGAVSSLFVSASNELGEAESGFLGAVIGPVPAVIAGGVGAIAIVFLWSWWFPELRLAKGFEASDLPPAPPEEPA
jgi:MFS family permease